MIFSKTTFFIFVSVFLFLTACKTTFVTYSEGIIPVEEAKTWNERVKIKTTDIHLKNGEVLKDKVTRIRSNEVIYVDKGNDLSDYRSLPLSSVREIHIKPQVSSNFYVGLALLSVSGYLLYSNYVQEDNPAGESPIGGILVPFALTTGSAYFFYNGIETETTVLKFE